MDNKLNYDEVWESMNALSENSNQLVFIREIIDDIIPYLDKGDVEISSQLLNAASTLLKVYIDKFDQKFDVAWKKTVGSMVRDESFDDFSEKFRKKVVEHCKGNNFHMEL